MTPQRRRRHATRKRSVGFFWTRTLIGLGDRSSTWTKVLLRPLLLDTAPSQVTLVKQALNEGGPGQIGNAHPGDIQGADYELLAVTERWVGDRLSRT